MDTAGPTSPFESPVFEIIAGESGNTKTFHAHASMLSQSKVLKTEVEGLWKESAEKKIQWPHWTVGGAEKFLEWLYTGDYKCPYPTKCLHPVKCLYPAKAAEAVSTGVLSKKDKKKGRKATSWTDDLEMDATFAVPPPIDKESEPMPAFEDFENFRTANGGFRAVPTPPPALPRLQDLTFPGCRPLNKISQAEEFDKWTGHHLWNPTELDYETTFMTHAELYIIATTYMLDDLKNMAWQRLRAVLISIGKPAPGSTVVDNIASLSHYVYTETGADGVKEEPLRMLVSGFAGLHFTNLKGQGMEELMMSTKEADREFVVDLMGKVAQQMSYLESKEDNTFSSVYA